MRLPYSQSDFRNQHTFLGNKIMNTPSSERIHIAFFGCRNAGKSTLVNEILGQNLSIVSDVKGTTTDPVQKAMELLPLGPVVIIDTPGYDDEGELGEQRIAKTRQILNKTDVAVLVVDSQAGTTEADLAFKNLIEEKKIPLVEFINKKNGPIEKDQLINSILQVAEKLEGGRKILDGIVNSSDTIVLVCPIDEAAPKGRLILPQQMVLREILDLHARAVVCQPSELKETITSFKVPPELVITDSQAFKETAEILPDEIPLTSFSILMARYKGFLEEAKKAVEIIPSLKDNDRILIAEGCTHKRQCGDIGSVKIPATLKKITGKDLEIEFTAGTQFPKDLSPYSLVIHCGGCMITEREILFRMKCAQDQKIPFCNYGIFLAHVNGILERSLRPLAAENNAS